jgi:DNA-binding beta-propeller fold protein YncE
MCTLAMIAGCNDPTDVPSVDATSAALPAVPVAAAASSSSFSLFESGQVRPLAHDSNYLYAVNTPAARLEIYKLGASLKRVGSVPVGLEPVAVAVSGNQAWVVNHLSDSVSIVDLSNGPSNARVSRTLLVGDEPRDIVFAGTNGKRAFITTAHRGQNTGSDPQLLTPSIGRADVWVFDANNLGASLGGTPLAVINLFTDTPRALAVSPDGARVYAAGFQTGNQTTIVNAAIVNAAGGPGMPPPLTNHQGVAAPATGLVVKWNGSHWVDERGTSWDQAVDLSLPDKDVFAIDANAATPVQVTGAAGIYAHVGTILFNMIVNPVNRKVYVTNLDSRNEVRFEGAGSFLGHRGVQGHIAESRISVLDPATGSVVSRHLNKHIDYSQCCAPIPNPENAKSLAFPTDMAISRDGKTLYVAALGSSKVGIYATAALEANTFVPSTSNQVTVTGGGATGLSLDDRSGLLYVLTRFDNGISTIDPSRKTEIAHVTMYNPEPVSITKGRRFLYDAAFTSSHGDSACASCHIFGDFDSLAWTLGDPDGDVAPDPGPFDNDPSQQAFVHGTIDFHPMKGPMTTQSLRGMSNHGPMHWRGDRTGALDASNNILASSQPDTGAYDEVAGFRKFNAAFVGLIGRNAPLSDADMDAFTQFILQVRYPPSPIRNLDDSDTDSQARARLVFNNAASTILTPANKCNDCHKLDPTFNANFGVPFPGVFGTDGNSTFVFESQLFKNSHLRNQYQKVGMFGNVAVPGIVEPGDNDFKGDQVRGFGYLHDGAVDTDLRFVSSTLFDRDFDYTQVGAGLDPGPGGDSIRLDLANFMLAFPTGLAPIVGQQVTLDAASNGTAIARVDLLESTADVGQSELVAKAVIAGQEIGLLYANGVYQTIDPHLTISAANVHALRQITAITFTAVPIGSGSRIAFDTSDLVH